jgi:hypothetical protein
MEGRGNKKPETGRVLEGWFSNFSANTFENLP